MPLKTPMKLSTRNQLKGTVIEVNKGPVDAIITLEVGEDNIISAVVPMDAVNRMGLAIGVPAYAIVSSFVVMLSLNPTELKLSTMNNIKGTIVEITESSVNANVKLEISENNFINSTVSMTAVKDMNLTVGKTAYAIASSFVIMLGVDPTEQVMDFGH